MKCKMTLSGKHLFMPLRYFSSTIIDPQEKVWSAHGVINPKKCIACGVIDDLRGSTKRRRRNEKNNRL